jgi:NADH-quinone oxidoreductase subunit L
MDFATDMLTRAWILPAIMAASFLVILLVGKRLPEKARSGIGIGAVAICFALSLVMVLGWVDRVGSPEGAEAVACGAEQYRPDPTAGKDKGEAKSEGQGQPDGSTTEGAVGTVIDAEAQPGVPMAPLAEGENAAPAVVAAPAEGEPATTVPVVCAVTWFSIGSVDLEFGFLVDGLSVMMLFVVTGISLLVHAYSTEYVRGDVRYTHYYAFLSLFTASMLFYVLSSNTLQMLMGWELVGLCSFGLIGHWWEEKKNSDAALKAFITNRVGDTGLIVGIIITFFAAGATSFNVFHINEYALSGEANTALLLVGALCLFAGVTSKSGQFPLHTWLPDAMAGPTPVSALIHAATMVVAGVYLIARLYAVFWGGLEISASTFHYVAFIGGLTTVVGAVLAFVQNDIKKVLAYSTISQLGYMVMALGVGAWTAGVFHLFTHAFFKAALFLGAGSVSHAAHHTFDMREMGGLRKYMPTTHRTFLLSTLALAGIFPFAGFWSKDEILAGSANGQGAGAYYVMLGMGLLTAFMTAAYMGRAYLMTFWGEYRGHGTPHESPRVMTVPLVILTVFAVGAGIINFPWALGIIPAHWFETMVQPTFAFPPELEVAKFSPVIAAVSLGLAALGLVVAWLYYQRNWGPHGLTSRNRTAAAGYRLLENKLYLDTLYTDGIVGGVKGPIARSAGWLNANVIDRVVNGAGGGARLVGNATYRWLDQGVVDTVVNASGVASDQSGQALRRVQTGKVQQYGAMLFGGAVVLGIVFVVISSINA